MSSSTLTALTPTEDGLLRSLLTLQPSTFFISGVTPSTTPGAWPLLRHDLLSVACGDADALLRDVDGAGWSESGCSYGGGQDIVGAVWC